MRSIARSRLAVPRLLASALGTLALAAALATSPAAHAQESPPAQPEAAEPVVAEEPSGPHLDWGLEVKAAYRDSDDNQFKVPFFPTLPPVFERTVSPGESFELVVATLYLDAVWGETLAGRVKVDMIDLYDRNPTSTDHKVDVDEAWIRYGREMDPGRLPPGSGVYVKVGKYGKIERQDDRHLESYGLVSTAFNRFEDAGVELGIDLGRHVFVKGTYTRGNPLFMRDPNALAGDNGTDEVPPGQVPKPALNTGVPILYDAEVEDVTPGDNAETGGAVGLRFSNEDGSRRFEVLAFGYQRELADRVELEGTFYGGDLDILSGPHAAYPQLHGRDKEEFGGNLWVYLDGLSFFGQYVDQEVAGLVRTGYEGEAAWRFDLPLVWAIAGQQLFPSVAPAVRYSKLEPEYTNPVEGTPAPSLAWEWEKLDYGVRLGITPGSDLTVEYAQNRFLTRAGWRDNNELLAVLRWRM